ncbi:hypothetical protein J6590_029232 [Homalodisca vitripennis]|nr:hypothetical protein J6590_029232 [Homalodisca vitripennis]
MARVRLGWKGSIKYASVATTVGAIYQTLQVPHLQHQPRKRLNSAGTPHYRRGSDFILPAHHTTDEEATSFCRHTTLQTRKRLHSAGTPHYPVSTLENHPTSAANSTMAYHNY